MEDLVRVDVAEDVPSRDRTESVRIPVPPNVRRPTVSVILAVRDRAACVARAIESVLAQDYPHLELIVVDDGSTDGTREAIALYGDRLSLVRQRQDGPYAARNLGLRHAKGDLIAFIDSDDAWLPGKLSAQVPLMRGEVGLVYGDTIHVRAPLAGAPRTGRTSFQVTPPRRGRAADHFAWGNFIPTCTVLVRRSCLDEIGGFSVSSPISADYLAWFRIASRHAVDHVDAPVAEYTVHKEGISFDLGRSLAARIQLFSAELARSPDEGHRTTVRRLLFNLALHLGLAAVRGRARSVERPGRLAWRTGWRNGRLHALPWATGFAFNQLSVRARRLLP